MISIMAAFLADSVIGVEGEAYYRPMSPARIEASRQRTWVPWQCAVVLVLYGDPQPVTIHLSLIDPLEHKSGTREYAGEWTDEPVFVLSLAYEPQLYFTGEATFLIEVQVTGRGPDEANTRVSLPVLVT